LGYIYKKLAELKGKISTGKVTYDVPEAYYNNAYNYREKQRYLI
jgi:hypothetical protein